MKNIPFIDLGRQYQASKTLIDQRIHAVLDHGQYIMGPEVAELEGRLAEYVGVKHCVGVSDGTTALQIAMMALEIRPGDEVITTPFTFIATGEMISLLGAIPVFVDIDPKSFNIDPGRIEAAITPKTKAIVPVSLYGQTADMDPINAIAQKHGIAVIEDAAQSFGAQYQGRRSCGLSTIATTSFFPSKPLGCYGDGGACFTNDEALAAAMREIRVHGQARRYVHTRVGLNGRLDTIQAAVVLAKLESFDEEVRLRQARANDYFTALKPLADDGKIGLPTIAEHNLSVFAQFTITLTHREAVQAALKQRGVPTAIHYPVPLHLQGLYADGQAQHRVAGSQAVSEAAGATVMSLPFSPWMETDTCHYIAQSLAESLDDVVANA